jgi:hypothetical protein
MGYLKGDIDMRFICMGAVLLLASIPGGPSAAATCIRTGCTMGEVKDVYMR